ncbi:MAG: hypothetical protein CL842_05540 [Crocinitomicaceae bacterium]|nr:hypothetical protein [Crocinitomicaceae bacterium]|tara:strand:+ start:1184 stop:2359 length:1176 start_codon:yes stop_codon:yes gene_type:complete
MYDIDFLIRQVGDGSEEITNIQDSTHRKIGTTEIASSGGFVILFDIGDGIGLTVDDMHILHAVRKRIYEIILGPSITVTVDFSILSLGDGVLGQAGWTGTTVINGTSFPYRGIVQMNTSNWTIQKETFKKDGHSLAYYTVLHEIFHVFGIGTLWDSLVNDSREYTGEHALREYKNTIGNDQLAFIPIEDDGGIGTADGHPEEGSGIVRMKNGITYPGLDRELMTGYSESTDNEPMILSRITVGFMEDLGYTVRYEGSDEMMYPALADWANYNNIKGGLLNPGQSVSLFIDGTLGPNITNLTNLYYRSLSATVNDTFSTLRIQSDGTLMISYAVIVYVGDSGISSTVTHEEESMVTSDSNIVWDLGYIDGTIKTIQFILKGLSYDYDSTYFE